MANVHELVNGYVKNIPANVSLQEALGVVRSKIEMAEKITKTLEANFKEWGMGEFITCPNCGSHTLFEFVECHWCGHQVLETVNAVEESKAVKSAEKVKEEPKKEEPKKEEPKKNTTANKVVSEKAVKRSMNGEPEATINYGLKTEAPVSTKAVQTKEALKLLKEALETAKDANTKGKELQAINESAGLKIDPTKDCNGKLSLFRTAVIENLTAKIKLIEKELKEAEKKTAETKKVKTVTKETKKTTKTQEDEELLLDEDLEGIEEEATPSKVAKVEKSKNTTKGKSKAKEVEVSESELNDEDFLDEEDVLEEVSNDLDVEGVEGVDLDTIDIEELGDDDFDLEE